MVVVIPSWLVTVISDDIVAAVLSSWLVTFSTAGSVGAVVSSGRCLIIV